MVMYLYVPHIGSCKMDDPQSMYTLLPSDVGCEDSGLLSSSSVANTDLDVCIEVAEGHSRKAILFTCDISSTG